MTGQIPDSQPADVVLNAVVRCGVLKAVTSTIASVLLDETLIPSGQAFRGVVVASAVASSNIFYAWYGAVTLTDALKNPVAYGLVPILPGSIIPIQPRGLNDVGRVNVQCANSEETATGAVYIL